MCGNSVTTFFYAEIVPKSVFRQNFRGVTQKLIYYLLTRRYGVDLRRQDRRRNDHRECGVDRDALLKLLTGSFDAVSEWLREGAAYYIWCASKTWDVFAQAVEQLGWPVREQLIWNKDCFVMGRQDYQWKHEPCLYGWKPGAAHKWCSDRSQTTVIDCPRPKANRDHPTMQTDSAV